MPHGEREQARAEERESKQGLERERERASKGWRERENNRSLDLKSSVPVNSYN